MKQIEIQIDDKPVIVKKLSLRKLAEVLSSLENIPKLFAIVEGKKNDELIGSLGEIINTCYPDVLKILQASTDIPKEELEEWGLADLIIVAETIYQLNQIGVLYDRIKKMPAQPKKSEEKPADSTPSNGSIPTSTS